VSGTGSIQGNESPFLPLEGSAEVKLKTHETTETAVAAKKVESQTISAKADPAKADANAKANTKSSGNVNTNMADVGQSKAAEPLSITLLSRTSCPECEKDANLWRLLPTRNAFKPDPKQKTNGKSAFSAKGKYNSCALVGDPSGLCGSVIDTYDAVVRFNHRWADVETNGDVLGTKTTHIVSLYFSEQEVDNKRRDHLPPPEFYEKNEKTFGVRPEFFWRSDMRSCDVVTAVEKFQGTLSSGWQGQFGSEVPNPPPEVNVLDFKFQTELNQRITAMTTEKFSTPDDPRTQQGCSKSYAAMPTTGFVGYEMMKPICEKIDLFGFHDKDVEQREQRINNFQHRTDQNDDSWRGHYWEGERKIYEQDGPQRVNECQQAGGAAQKVGMASGASGNGDPKKLNNPSSDGK